jgi:hypothetical protein
MVDDELDEVLQREQMIFEDARERPRDGVSILRRRNTRLDLETFAPLFARLLQVPKFEATKLCQLDSGLLLDNIEAKLAETVAAELRTRGEECLIVAAGEMVQLPRPHPVNAMRLDKQGLAVRGTTDDWYRLAWSDLTCLAMGQAAFEETKRTSRGLLTRRITSPGYMGGDPISTIASAVAPRSNVSVSTSKSQHELIEIVSLIPLAYCHIDARHFDYSLLGDQRQNASTANALTLVRWLLTYAPQMRTNIDLERLMQTGRTPIPSVTQTGLREISGWLANVAKFASS